MLDLESIFHYHAVIERLRAMSEPPTASHSPLSPRETPPSSGSGTITDEDTLPSSQVDETPPTTQCPESLVYVPATPVINLGTSLRKAKRSRRIARPVPDSLFDILHQHAGTPLFVRPVCWTDEHPRFLGARFEEQQPCTAPLPENIPGSPPPNGYLRPSKTIKTLSESLTNILEPVGNHPILTARSVKTVMAMLWPNTFRSSKTLADMPLFFGDRVYYNATRVQLLWDFPGDTPLNSQASFRSTSTRATESYASANTCSTPSLSGPTSRPMMCYMSKMQLACMRQNLFRIAQGPGKSANGPVTRLQQLRCKALVPTNPDHDPYLVSLFLAMAQRHFYGDPGPSTRRDTQWSPKRGEPERPNFQDVKLRILVDDSETAEFLVYTAVVKAEFLDRFHDPLRTPKDEDDNVPGLDIKYRRVPIWPILGLRERMGRALGQDLVGTFDLSAMETWETEADDTQGSQAKRKREALSEVLNGSYEEETEEEGRSPVVKKRRLGEASPVGVVV